MNESEIIHNALEEDLGASWKDVSVEALGSVGDNSSTSKVIVKEAGIVCGLWLIDEVIKKVMMVCGKGEFSHLFSVECYFSDGEFVEPGSVIAEIDCPVGIILSAERTILNFLQRLSGIATLTKKFVVAVSHTKCKILDTRKTAPGLRCLDKLATKFGGALNHRFGLYDMVMLKDNHIKAMDGNIKKAVEQTRMIVGPTKKIEVETSTFEEVKAAVGSGADMVMLDNMSIELMKKCVAWVKGRVPLEASGGINLENAGKVADTGVDYISVGEITHSPKALDISLKIVS
ncbi:carboxylating nicotinate-nucleotide diphosphorylase [bacterium]|nr:carboxylating nicotinate-nucleotide diphosphorylase [bacterium]